ncbi:MAG: sialate O-acetylesterase [Clostridia bacterium]|nr:sialate O-acetylesterase [Clostridia bacterium]
MIICKNPTKETAMVYDIVVFSGQSNMQGQSDRLTESKEVKGAFEYKMLTGTFAPLKNPVGEDVRPDGSEGCRVRPDTDGEAWIAAHALGSACYGNTNLVPEFCRAYIRKTGRSVAAVSAAKGSTEIEYWMKGNLGYEFLVRKTLAARAALEKSGAETGDVYVVWLQGESDAIFQKKRAEYLEKLSRLGGDLKKDIGMKRFGIIKVGRFTGDARDDEIIGAQEDAAEKYPETFIMLSETAEKMDGMPGMMHPTIGGHYSAKGLEFLGKEAGESLGDFANNSN